MTDMNKATHTEELYVWWTPGRNARSLSSDYWTGSTLSHVAEGRRSRHAVKELNRKRDRDRRTYDAAKRDFAYFRGQV